MVEVDESDGVRVEQEAAASRSVARASSADVVTRCRSTPGYHAPPRVLVLRRGDETDRDPAELR